MKSQKGAAAVEFAIVLPLLVLLLFGIIEFSTVYYDQAVITNASREGARAGIVFFYDVNAEEQDRKSYAETKAKDAARRYCGNDTKSRLISFAAGVPTVTVNANLEGDGDPGDNLTVTVGYHYDYLVIPNFATGLDEGGIDLSATTLMRLE
jgi:Flp pilus assembly protein TadG